jgi:paraquat-inducible protein B
MSTQNIKSLLLGLGFDNKDGHCRITQGDNFRLYGGSKDTHSLMQEKAIKFNEQLKRKGKTLDEISPVEFRDIARQIDLKLSPDN